ncbi:PEP/pyruvate-binding domain-containing protein [Pseudonocardia ailaonensis]|uniref:PEP/pyruvate-binding domain-containing protein n=1 Tax=Pseudonocardia ailaonensis TaxID=367279 RepID=A0ABN2N3L2_9PSEU
MGYLARFSELGSADVATAGGKGANLGELTRAGLPVPPGAVLLTSAYDDAVAAAGIGGRIAELAADPDRDAASARIRELFREAAVPEDIAAAVREAYAELGGAVAVRSSATAEDLAGASFAGQQDTLLDVRGEEAVLAAVVECWSSLWTARAMEYRAGHRARQGIGPDPVSLAVVIQRMVDADASGVLFTADPTTGRRDRIAIGAAWGLGESVVGGLVSTDDLVVDRVTFAEVSRRIADKAEMTVRTGGGTAQVPVPAQMRRAPVLDPAAAAELARLGARIEEHFGAPQDIEWCRAAGVFAIVQSRPVTALPPPAADPPRDWPLPYRGGLYFRASIVEQMPDPLTPLFADLVDGAVTRALSALFAQIVGGAGVREGDLRFPTVNGYAYYFYRGSGLARLTVRMPLAFRTLRGTDGSGRAGIRGWREHAHPEYAGTVASWAVRDLAGMSPAALLDGAATLLEAGCRYYTAVQSIIPLAATAEIAFAAFYDRAVRRPGDPAAGTFLVGADSVPILAEKSLYDLAAAARVAGLAESVAAVDTDELVRAVRDDDPPAGADPQAWRGWATLVREHLARYGHTVYDLDFSAPTPADEPGPLLGTVRRHLTGEGADPYARQRRLVDRRDAQTALVRHRLGPLRRRTFDALLRRARETGPVREDALADMGLAWPLIRRMLRELGGRLVEACTLTSPDDVYWLTAAELRAGVPGPVEERRMLHRGRRLVAPPQMLPELPRLERALQAVMPARDRNQTGSTIRGIAAASGAVTATARVLRGPEDFSGMRPGEVLVARITTPAWTSLFAQAAAVVTDVGGPLSHSSIVAREYGIPAVLGTGAATTRIRTGDRVRVDGDAGTVTLLEG